MNDTTDRAEPMKGLPRACEAFRDSVLHGRGHLEAPCLDNDQTNAVLAAFDEIVGAELEACRQRPAAPMSDDELRETWQVSGCPLPFVQFKAIVRAVDHYYAAQAVSAEPVAQKLVDECAQYLKEGETPAQCVARNRDDAFAAIRLYYNDAHRYQVLRAIWLDRDGGAETGVTMEMCRAESEDEFDKAVDALREQSAATPTGERPAAPAQAAELPEAIATLHWRDFDDAKGPRMFQVVDSIAWHSGPPKGGGSVRVYSEEKVLKLLAQAAPAQPCGVDSSRAWNPEPPCWLVEQRKDGRTVAYLGHANGSYEWMPTPDKATRFVRREDANGVAECLEFDDVIVAEHIWG
jgi:hypothetical protein